MKRRIIFPPTEIWNQRKEQHTMSENFDFDKPNPRDIRMAAVLTIHHRTGSADGMTEIVRETAETNRATGLLMSVLNLHMIAIAQLRTEAGVAYIRSYVESLAEVKPTDESGMDLHRAILILDGHAKGDFDQVNEALRKVRAENRGTQTLIALLDLYTTILPELSSQAGKQWLDACVASSHTEERAEKKRQEESE